MAKPKPPAKGKVKKKLADRRTDQTRRESGRCNCGGCDRCDPAGGPCTREAVVGSDNRCQECHDRAAEQWTMTIPPVIEINVFDAVGVGVAEAARVEIGPEHRSWLKRALEKVLSSVFSDIEVGVEVSPDGTVRVYLRRRS